MPSNDQLADVLTKNGGKTDKMIEFVSVSTPLIF